MEWQQRRERAELGREHGRESLGVEQEADRAYQPAMREPIQVGAEDREALALEVRQQAQGLSPDQQGMDLGIERVHGLNIERDRDGPDIG